MSSLFTPFSIRHLSLPNRLLRSATWEGMADDAGFILEPMLGLYRALAAGGVGLIVTGYAYVRPEGKGLPAQTGIYDDAHLEGLTRLAATIHEAGGRAFVQIVHAGGQTNPEITGGLEPIAPSEVPYPSHKVTPRQIDGGEIPELVAAFASAARRVQRAGFDGVQLHGAHGYLINRFLSPVSNRRGDGYGGSLEKRARFGAEVVEAVRQACGPDFPVSMKLNVCDFEEGGLSPEDSLGAARRFVEAGLDHLELSGGTPAAGKLGAVRKGVDAPDKEAYFRPWVSPFTRELPIPVTLVGGIRSLELAEAIVSGGEASSVALCRPLISEPDLPARWQRGETAKARCISDGACFGAGMKGGIRCPVFEG